MSSEKPKEAQQIQVIAGDEISRGRYSNNMLVSHSGEEFMIDWFLNSPTGTHMVSRIIVSPGHMQRIIEALGNNLQKYESKFGGVRPMEPKDQSFN